MTLLRDFANKKTSVGSQIQLTDVAVQLFNDENPLSATSRTTLKILLQGFLLINYFKEILLLASQKYVRAYIAKILLSFHKEVQSLEVNITIKFFAFE